MVQTRSARERDAMDALLREHSERDLRLTAPEIEVLLRGSKATDRQILRVAITELVVQETFGFVTVHRARLFGPAQRIHLLTRGRTFDSDAGPSLQAVLDVYRDARPASRRSGGRWPFGLSEEDKAKLREDVAKSVSSAAAAPTPRKSWAASWAALHEHDADLGRAEMYADATGIRGVPITSLAAAVFRRYPRKGSYGNLNQGYVRHVVLPELAGRGLVRLEPYRRFGVFRSMRWTVTPAGIGAKEDIERRLAARGSSGRRRKAEGVLKDLRSRAGFLGTPESIDRVFAAIKSGVQRGWSNVYDGD